MATTNCSSACFTCASLRTITDAAQVGYINENFAAIREQLEKLCALVDKYITVNGIDANGQCVTNVKYCENDPHSAVPISAVQELIRAALLSDSTQCNGCKTGCKSCSPQKHDCNCSTSIPNAY